MKKGVLVLVLILSTLFLISFVSASFWDLFGITGKAITDTNNANLVTYYPFDINANDQSGHGNNLGCSSVSVCPGVTNGKISKAYNFDGSNDQYTDYSTSNLDINQYSASAWIKSSMKQGRMSVIEFTRGSANGNNRRGIAVSGNDNFGKPIIYYGNDKMRTGNTGDLRDGVWHHILVLYNGTSPIIYVDGNVASLSAEDTTNVGNASSYLRVGNSITSDSKNYFSGIIDDVRIYNKALSYSEVQEIYQYGISTTCTPSWSCTAWSTCSNGQQTRTCTDSNNCGTTSGKPAESQSCLYGCDPLTCSQLGKQCGSWDNGCGEMLNCGVCTYGYSCSSNGQCVQNSTQQNCTDTDGGINYYVKGNAGIEGSTTIMDLCLNYSTLAEAFCNNGGSPIVKSVNYNCQYGCSNGACLSETLCEGVYLDTGGTKLYVGDKINNARNVLTKIHLPTLLAQDTIKNSNGQLIEVSPGYYYEYVQYLYIGNSNILDINNPYIFINTNPSIPVYNYSIQFSTPVDFSSSKFHGSSLQLLGDKFIIRDSSTNNNIILYNKDKNYNLTISNNNNLKLNDYSLVGTKSVISGSGGVYAISISFAAEDTDHWKLYSGQTFKNEAFQRLKLIFETYDSVNGAKIKVGGDCINTNQTQTCTDSDGGKESYIKGIVKLSNGRTESDYCVPVAADPADFIGVNEWYCSGSNINQTIIDCPNGCSDGACLESNNTQINKTCLDLVAQVKNPTSFENNGVKYDLNWNSSYSGNWRDGESYSEYDAGWTLSYNDGDNYKYGYLDKSTLVFDNPDFNAIDVMDDFTQYGVCQVHTYGSSDWNQDYRVYVCNWNVFDKGVSVDRYSYENREIVWASDNVILRMSYGTGQYLTDEQLSQIIEKGTVNFLNALIDNRGRYLGWENFNIDWPFDIQIFDALVYCPSDVPEDTCSPYWECVTEPAICPEYGTQQQTCRDASCGNEDITSIISCNPGICSGCLVPKWLDSKSFADNKCIPYGFRFENQIGFGEDVVSDQEDAILSVAQASNSKGELNLSISSDGVASLRVDDWGGNKTYTFSKGDKVEIDVSEWGGDYISATLFANDVVYNSENYEESYIDVSFEVTYKGQTIKTANSYCEIDGNVKVQKPSVPGQEWPKCQNNYECESNVCSGGECIPVSQYIKEGGRLKGFFFNLLCNIAYPINEDKRAQCVANFLGA